MCFSRHAFGLALVLLSVLSFAQSSRPATESSSKPHAKHHESTTLEPGSTADGVYRNASLNFSYKIPFGWVDRTSDMREGSETGKSEVLLSAFERPPEVKGEGINSAVVIAAENRSSYPGLKMAAEYLDPITELATSKGFKVAHEPYEFSVGGKQMVRCDYVKDKSAGPVHQSSLAFLHKDWIVSITFLGTSDDEIDELIRDLSFSTTAGHASK